MGLHFSAEEFKNRKDKVIKLLKQEKLDAILMFRQESMYWLTGYDTFGYVIKSGKNSGETLAHIKKETKKI